MSKKNNQISIIIPCLNAEKTIEKTLQSLREQTNKNFECIVMDGNSSDNTKNIVNLFNDVVDKFISQDDKSGADAANKGVKLSSGNFIIFLYADDYVVSNFIDDIVTVINKNKNIDYVSYGLQMQSLKNKNISLQSYKKINIESNLKNACFKHVLNHAYNRNIFNQIGNLKHLYFDNKIFYSNDREFLIRICLNNKKNIVIEKILYIMQTHKGSYTGSKSNIVRIRYEHIGIADYYLDNISLSESQRDTLRLFKTHNLALLLAWYVLTINFRKVVEIFHIGLKHNKIMWIYYIFSRPISELFYRLSVLKLI